jgi:hypothetical protein
MMGVPVPRMTSWVLDVWENAHAAQRKRIAASLRELNFMRLKEFNRAAMA